MRPPVIVLCLSLLLFVPSASAAEIEVTDASGLEQVVEATDAATVVEFRTDVRVERAGEVYLKVLASQDNPVYRNGTVGGGGWWTDVALDNGSGFSAVGATNGSATVPIDTVDEGSVVALRLMVHAPSGALSAPGEHRFVYIVAVRASSSGNGSGGSLSPSITVMPKLVVTEPLPHAAGEEEPENSGRAPGASWALAALALATVAGARARVPRSRVEE